MGAAPPHVLTTLAAPRRLVRRYGTEAPAVHALGARDARLGEPVLSGHPVTGAELLWALRHEGALDESDLLDRRTRIGLVPADRTAALPPYANSWTAPCRNGVEKCPVPGGRDRRQFRWTPTSCRE
ncbi:glycerol-3-phosphate dehydrogenase C-terminal domain-containing protein [Streptomyces sp. INA 01156]